MKSLVLFFNVSLLLILNAVYIADGAECNGCIILDSKTFNKVLSKFDVMLVKFDKHNPDKKKHAIFEQVSTDISKEFGMENMVAAHVDVMSDGMVKNMELVEKYGLHDDIFGDKLPAIFTFFKRKDGMEEPKTNETHLNGRFKDYQEVFDDETEWRNVTNFDADALKRSIRFHTGIYFTLPGCFDEFDFLAIKFAAEITKFKKASVVAEAEAKLLQLPQEESVKRAIAQDYIDWMNKATESGESTESYVYQETSKMFLELSKTEGVSKEEKEKMKKALNIFDSFNLAGRFQMVEAPEHDEL